MGRNEGIILIGGGGHCRSAIDVIEESGNYTIAGIVDIAENVGKKIQGYSIIGSDNDLDRIAVSYANFLITIGHIKSNILRKRLFDDLKSRNGNFPVIISPYAHVSKQATIEEGTIVFHNAIVNASAHIGKNNIINTASIVEHDVTMGNHCHLAPGAIVNGASIIGDDCFIGSQAVILQGLNLGVGSLIAAGCIVRESTSPQSFIAGNPGIKKGKL